jgi:predicted PurR-regulated permease PerM
LIDTSAKLAEEYDKGTLVIPPPEEKVKEWPLVGDKVYAIWNQSSSNLEGTLKQYAPQIKKVGEAILAAVAGAGGGVLQFVLAIIISGILLANTTGAHSTTLKIASRLAGKEHGEQFTNLTTATIRSVAQGVLGVAIIQAILGGAGMYFMDVPGWGLWTILILILAVAQLPPALILLPVIFYVFSVADTTPAVIFTIWSVIVSMSDSFLKPMFLGRGMETPMLVILLGAIGGMMLSGIIGLFVGAIILALGYELFMTWLNKNMQKVEV